MSVQPVGGQGPVDGLVVAAGPERVRALLIGRPPAVLTQPSSAALLTEVTRGVASEVRAVIGSAPGPELFDLASWAVVLGTASSIEAALFPEQQLGDQARSEQLRGRYLGVLADVRRKATASGVGNGRYSGPVHLGAGGASYPY